MKEIKLSPGSGENPPEASAAKKRKIHMQYRSDQKGTPLSILGFGCMRFTKKYGKIVHEKAEKEVMLAIRHGVNYFDTAYIYPGSEECLGKILADNHCREQVHIATKLPHYLIKSKEGLEKCFQEQWSVQSRGRGWSECPRSGGRSWPALPPDIGEVAQRAIWALRLK